MKKKKYELYEEYFKSTIDNEYHKETYYTTNEKLYEKKMMFDKASNRYDMFGGCIIVFLIAIFIFVVVDLALWLEYNNLIGSFIVSIITLCWIIGLIISRSLYVKNKIIYDLTYSWREEFISSKEYKRQVEEYTKIYKENLKNKLLKASAKLVDIYTALDGNHPCVNEYNRNSKIYLIADLLDIQDAEKILNINKK